MKLNTKNLNDIDTSFPIFAKQVLFAQLEACLKPNKKGTGNNLEIKAHILDQTIALKDGGTSSNEQGKVTLIRNMSLVRTENYDPDKTLAFLAKAIFGDEPVPEEFGVEHIHGAYCKIKVGITPATAQYGEKNEIASFLAITEEDNFVEPTVGLVGEYKESENDMAPDANDVP